MATLQRKKSLTFADILDREIVASEKTQGQIARESGVQRILLGNYRSGLREPNLENVLRLCAVFPSIAVWIAGAQLAPIASDNAETNAKPKLLLGAATDVKRSPARRRIN